MVKLISINGFAKKTLLTASLLAVSVLSGASNPIKNLGAESSQQNTELMSKECAEAPKSDSIPQTTVPTVHNPKLDKTFKKFAESQEEINDITVLQNNVYSRYGTYLGSVLIQKEIDKQMLWAFLYKRTDLLINNDINPDLGKRIQSFGKDFYTTITPNADKINKWKHNEFDKVINNNLYFDHKPTAVEVRKRLDEIAELQLEPVQFTLYCIYFKDFVNQIENNPENYTASDALAYLMHIINSLIFAQSLCNAGVFEQGSYYNHEEEKGMQEYFREFMKSVAPNAK